MCVTPGIPQQRRRLAHLYNHSASIMGILQPIYISAAASLATWVVGLSSLEGWVRGSKLGGRRKGVRWLYLEACAPMPSGAEQPTFGNADGYDDDGISLFYLWICI
jgi:hypothetical protein